MVMGSTGWLGVELLLTHVYASSTVIHGSSGWVRVLHSMLMSVEHVPDFGVLVTLVLSSTVTE